MGGVGEMKNVRSFLGLDAGMVGCVRRLEINDKYYNLEAAVHGGDIVAGRDIGEWSDHQTPGAGTKQIFPIVFPFSFCPRSTLFILKRDTNIFVFIL